MAAEWAACLSINWPRAKCTTTICIPRNCLVAKCRGVFAFRRIWTTGSFTIKSNVGRSRCLLSKQTRCLSSRIRAKRYTKNSHREYSSPYVARAHAKSVPREFRTNRKFACKSVGKSRDRFAGHVRQIEAIKSISLFLFLSPRMQPKGIHKSILARLYA